MYDAKARRKARKARELEKALLIRRHFDHLDKARHKALCAAIEAARSASKGDHGTD